MEPEREVAIGGLLLTRRDVDRLLYSDKLLAHPTRIKNYYVLRSNGDLVGAKAIVYSLGGGDHHGRDAVTALLRLGIPVHAKRRYRTTDVAELRPFREAGLLIFDEEDEVEQHFETTATEGKAKLHFGPRYERSRRLRNLSIQIHGLTCKVCGFNFAATYGEYGAGYVEVHHLRPLSSVKGEMEVSPKTDMTVVCSNCHRMLHLRNGHCLTIEQLRAIVSTMPK